MKLGDKAMLASLNLRQWTAKKYDKKISKEIAAKHNIQPEMEGRYNKPLLAKAALEEIQKIVGQARTDFYTYTLPWAVDGARILPSANYMKLADILREHKRNFEPAVDKFCENYPQLVLKAKATANGAFNADDYPSESAIKSKFAFDFHIAPLPQSNDFRVQLSDDEIELVKSQIESDNKESLKQSKVEVFNRMRDVVARMAERLKSYTGKREGSFRDTLVTNISDLLDIIPGLNLEDDSKIQQFAQEMRDLCKYSGETLRESVHARKATAETADDILKKIQEYAA